MRAIVLFSLWFQIKFFKYEENLALEFLWTGEPSTSPLYE
jgi:hypothetical protein